MLSVKQRHLCFKAKLRWDRKACFNYWLNPAARQNPDSFEIIKMETKIVPPAVIADLPSKYWARRIPSESRQNPAMLYKGVVFRVDNGFSEEQNGVKVFQGMEYFFQHGFTQQYINESH